MLVAGQQIGRCLTNESSTIGVEGTDKVTYFVDLDVSDERAVGFGVQVIGPDETLLLSSWYGKGPHAGHDVAHCLAFTEHVAEALVLGV